MGFTDGELKGLAEHVVYEVDELRKAAQRLSRVKKDDADWNSAIEVFLLHFRNLRAFFLGEKSHTDDLIAKHFLPSWKPSDQPIYGETKRDINKRLAHLTTSRLEVFKRGWQVRKMYGALESTISEFEQSLTASRKEWFPNLKQRPNVLVLGAGDYTTVSTNSPQLLNIAWTPPQP